MSRVGMIDRFGFLDMGNTETALVDVYRLDDLPDTEKDNAIRRYRAELSLYPVNINKNLVDALKSIGFLYILDYTHHPVTKNNQLIENLKYNPDGIDKIKSLTCISRSHKKVLISAVNTLDKINSKINKKYNTNLNVKRCNDGQIQSRNNCGQMTTNDCKRVSKAIYDINEVVGEIVTEEADKKLKERHNSDDYITNLIKKKRVMFDEYGYIVNYSETLSIRVRS